MSGHTHRPGYGFVNGIPIIRAGSSGRGIGVVDLRRDGGGTRLLGTRVDTAFVDRVTPDAALLAAMTPYRLLADSLAERPVAHLREPLLQFRGEYPLGRLVVDAVRLAGEADVGLSNRGGVRASLPEGPVGYGDLFRVKPFGNQVVRLPLSGSELRRVVERALGPPDFLSGVVVEFDATRPAGERIVTLRLSDGRPVEDDGRYTLATSNFLSGGSGGYDFLAAIPAETQGMTILDAFILHLQGLPQPVVAPADARLVAVTAAR